MMPFYGDPELFRLAVASVQEQTDPNWTLTILDDLYPDESIEQWVRGLGDPRVEYRRNSKNLGVAANFAQCLRVATTEYLVIMGCDDLMRPNYVSAMRTLVVAHPHADYFQPGVRAVDGQGKPVRGAAEAAKARARARAVASARASSPTPSVELWGESLAASLLNANWTYFPSILWKAKTAREHGFRQEFHVVLDLALQLDIIAAGGSLVVDDTVLFDYRRHDASVSSWRAADGTRFEEERRFFTVQGELFDRMGWRAAAAQARLHATSRLNALATLPRAISSGSLAGVGALLKHASALPWR